MTVNKNKVIAIPAEYRDNEDAFMCPCPVCIERVYNERAEKTQIEQAKNIIENIFETSSLNNKEFQINVAYADALPASEIIKPTAETRTVKTAVKLVFSFTDQFNRRYRHPLVCKLNAQAMILQNEIDTYDCMVHYGELLESRLWKFETIAKSTADLSDLLSEIEKEDFLDSQKVTILASKIDAIAKSAKIQLKKLFIKALKIPEFEPHCSFNDFQLPYYQ